MSADTCAVNVVAANQMSTADWRRYDQLLVIARSQGELHSPFLSSPLLRAYMAHRDSVCLARGRSDGGEWMFFFEAASEQADRVAAVGTGLLEWQAVVSDRPGALGVDEVAAATGWKSLIFDHMSPSQFPVDDPRCNLIVAPTPWVDLSQGFEAYCERRRELGGSLLKQTMRKSRKLEREVGPLQFERNADVGEAMSCLLQWKALQHERTNVPDAFAQQWLVSLLHAVAEINSDGFRGRISLLRSGGRPVAVHLGVETATHAHLWYPAYDHELRQYSPGNVLFLQLARALSECGLQRFDFGPGGQSYKDRFKTDDDVISRGSWDASPWHAMARRGWSSVRDRAKSLKVWLGNVRG